MQLLEGPIVIALGFAYGIIFGLIAQYLPNKKDVRFFAVVHVVVNS